jgi:hypothetical protein
MSSLCLGAHYTLEWIPCQELCPGDTRLQVGLWSSLQHVVAGRPLCRPQSEPVRRGDGATGIQEAYSFLGRDRLQ